MNDELAMRKEICKMLGHQFPERQEPEQETRQCTYCETRVEVIVQRRHYPKSAVAL